MRTFQGIGILLWATVSACQRQSELPSSGTRETTASASSSKSDSLLLLSVRTALPPEGFGPSDLPEANSVGAQLVAKYCAQCHALPTPSAHSATDWPAVARRMWLRMDQLPKTAGVQVPLMGERAQMLNYLTEYALVVSGGALPQGRGSEAFAKICSRCHALPDPGVYSSQDWVAVFQRMERNMGRMKVAPPTSTESEGILLYLTSLPPRSERK